MLQEAELSATLIQEHLGGPSETMYFIGLDVHKKTISYCVKDAAGGVYQEARSDRPAGSWMSGSEHPQPRTIAMEATIFTGWISDHPFRMP